MLRVLRSYASGEVEPPEDQAGQGAPGTSFSQNKPTLLLAVTIPGDMNSSGRPVEAVVLGRVDGGTWAGEH